MIQATMGVRAHDPSTDDRADDEIDLLELFGVLIDSRWLIIAITAFFLAAGVAYIFVFTGRYRCWRGAGLGRDGLG